MPSISESRAEAIARALIFDAAADKAEELRAGFSTAHYLSGEMAREKRSRNVDAEPDLINHRNAAVFVRTTTKERDEARSSAFTLREALGDFVSADALSDDYRRRYAAAASNLSTSATLLLLTQDPETLVAEEARFTWRGRHGTAPAN